MKEKLKRRTEGKGKVRSMKDAYGIPFTICHLPITFYLLLFSMASYTRQIFSLALYHFQFGKRELRKEKYLLRHKHVISGSVFIIIIKK